MQSSSKVDLGLVRQLSQCTAEIQRLKVLVAEKDRAIAERDVKIKSLMEASHESQSQSADTSMCMPPPTSPAQKVQIVDKASPSVGKADRTPLHTATGLNPFILHLMQSPTASHAPGTTAAELRETGGCSTTRSSSSSVAGSSTAVGYTPASKGDVLATLDELETNNSAIRRRSLRRMFEGRGVSSDLNPCESGYRKLFQQGALLRFDRDSPDFRRKVEDLGENVEGLRQHIARLVSITREYRQVGTRFGDLGRSLAEEMMHLKGDAWFKRLGDLAPVLVRFGESIDEIQGYQDIFLESLENVFAAPMEAFAKREVKEMRKARKLVTKTREEYEDVLAKYLSWKPSAHHQGDGKAKGSDKAKDGKGDKLYNKHEAELANKKRQFELARFDQVCSLNQLETRKKFQLVERICSALYANLGFFHQCHTVVATLEPTMRDLNHQLQLARREFAQEQRLWSAKRTRLEKQLNRGSFPHLSQQRRVSLSGGASMLNVLNRGGGQSQPSAGMGGSAGVGNDGNGDNDGSFQQGQGRRTRASSSFGLDGDAAGVSDDTVLKAGFLFKRSANMRRDWKRRWFSIQGGKLYYQRESKDKGYGKNKEEKGKHDNGGDATDDDDDDNNQNNKDSSGKATRRKSEQLSDLMKGMKVRSMPIKRHSLKKDHGHGHGGAKFEEPVEVCDILLCTVRVCNPNSSNASTGSNSGGSAEHNSNNSSSSNSISTGSARRFTFEIISPNNRPYMLQAQSESEMQSWIKCIQSEIGNQLSKQSKADDGCGGGSGDVGEAGTGHGGRVGAMDHTEEDKAWGAHCRRLRKLNRHCADCGARAPEWASINLGMMMCIECSGVHRMLGVHISKVRSLTLDEWPTSVRQLMEAIGNERSNEIWEAKLQQPAVGFDNHGIDVDGNDSTVVAINCVVDGITYAKPGPTCSRKEREEWIRSKYQYCRFVPNVGHSSAGLSNADDKGSQPHPTAQQLVHAVAEGAAPLVVKFIAQGADLNAALEGPGQKQRTAVHVACARGQLACLELLLANGASMYTLDEDDLAPLDYAMGNHAKHSGNRVGDENLVGAGSEDCMALLVSKLEDGDKKHHYT